MNQIEISNELLDYLAEDYQSMSKDFKLKYRFVDYVQYYLAKKTKQWS